jgi:hypothetical protein
MEGLDLIAWCLGFGLPHALVIQEKLHKQWGSSPHLERESIFGSAKRKLIFLLGMIVILINTIG